VISRGAILDFAKTHADAYVPLMNWYRITKRADWKNLADVRRDFSHADVVGRRTVFNIKGNHYRLDVQISYATKVVLVKRIGTHAEYDTWTF